MRDVTDNKVNIEEFWFDLRTGRKRLGEFSEDVVHRMTELSNLSRGELQNFFDTGVLREKSSPKAGSKAPGFQLELLDRHGNRTGEMTRLTQSLDKPVALVFGSYT